MVGTRLVVHTTFVIELLVLVAASFFYASNRRHDPLSSAEPFLADQSGWRFLVEDVSQAPKYGSGDVGSFAYVAECASAAISKIRSLTGFQSEKDALQDTPRRRLSSAFVQEMRLKIAGFRFVGQDDYQESTAPTRILPPLKVILYIPQVTSLPALNSLAEALERGLLSQSIQSPDLPLVNLSMADSAIDSRYDHATMSACDDFHLPTQFEVTSNRREVKHPEILILMGCTGVTIPDEQITSVEVSRSSDVIVVRSRLTVHQNDELRSHLEDFASREILSNMFVASHRKGCRLGSVAIDMVDENPASHVEEGSGSTSKARFDIIGGALSSSVQSLIGPLLDDLSFIYGGKIAEGSRENIEFGENVILSKGAIALETHLSAYAYLTDDGKWNASDDYQSALMSCVSPNSLVQWAHAHSRQPVRIANTGLDCRDDVRWTLFVPSQDIFPLRVCDESSGEDGESIIFSPPESSGGRSSVYPNGLSIVNLPKFSDSLDSNADKFYLNRQAYQSYKDRISAALFHLMGYLRAMHGLTTSVITKYAYGQGFRVFSFWELESIARSHYYLSLETAFHETDTLFALLRQHGSTLALPEDVAHRLNNATRLLRQSILHLEQGYPMIYATSLLHGSLQHLESVQIDHRILGVPYFALDHYLAVFSPLVLPLLLPMMSGLIREVKRFRKLRNDRGVI
ncbi:hypothetical protein ACHAW5_004863 [Stephanodiscus triporus]|uniref:GPI transamidase component PIG-S n=1 Tax=Stephanodiscus triporus TaxID=2934178 RepID=A0ABD3N5K4_9STRA